MTQSYTADCIDNYAISLSNAVTGDQHSHLCRNGSKNTTLFLIVDFLVVGLCRCIRRIPSWIANCKFFILSNICITYKHILICMLSWISTQFIIMMCLLHLFIYLFFCDTFRLKSCPVSYIQLVNRQRPYFLKASTCQEMLPDMSLHLIFNIIQMN